MTELNGTEMNLNGKSFVVPALNFTRLKALREEMQLLKEANLNDALDDTQIEASITIIHTALTRNYPDLSRDEVEDLVDLHNLPQLMGCIMGVSAVTGA